MAPFTKLETYSQRWRRGHKARHQGQGPKKNPRSRLRTAFSRTESLEAKDQGHKRKRSPKKKVLQKIFSGDLPFIGVPRIFDWGRPKPQITWYDVIKIFPKRKFLRDKDIVRWKIWNRCCLFARNTDFTDRGFGAGAPSRRRLWGSGGEAPAVERFFVIFWKKSYFNAIGSHFAIGGQVNAKR